VLRRQALQCRAQGRLENRLHKEVCSGALTLEEAQQGIAKDWRGLYQKYFGNAKEN
jgi:hypothetical protein